MLSLKLKQAKKNSDTSCSPTVRRHSIRDKLLEKQVPDMGDNLPASCEVDFADPNCLHTFQLTVTPDSGYWLGGKFVFKISVPEEYNNVPPTVVCNTRLYHPNITETGEVCLSLLRQNSYDSLGWAPTRSLKDVIWGLNSLFTDLLNFDDPLNVEAAELFAEDKDLFASKVKSYIQQYSQR